MELQLNKLVLSFTSICDISHCLYQTGSFKIWHCEHHAIKCAYDGRLSLTGSPECYLDYPYLSAPSHASFANPLMFQPESRGGRSAHLQMWAKGEDTIIHSYCNQGLAYTNVPVAGNVRHLSKSSACQCAAGGRLVHASSCARRSRSHVVRHLATCTKFGFKARDEQGATLRALQDLSALAGVCHRVGRVSPQMCVGRLAPQMSVGRLAPQMCVGRVAPQMCVGRLAPRRPPQGW